jgi:hypothetical protein
LPGRTLGSGGAGRAGRALDPACTLRAGGSRDALCACGSGRSLRSGGSLGSCQSGSSLRACRSLGASCTGDALCPGCACRALSPCRSWETLCSRGSRCSLDSCKPGCSRRTWRACLSGCALRTCWTGRSWGTSRTLWSGDPLKTGDSLCPRCSGGSRYSCRSSLGEDCPVDDAGGVSDRGNAGVGREGHVRRALIDHGTCGNVRCGRVVGSEIDESCWPGRSLGACCALRAGCCRGLGGSAASQQRKAQ